MISRYIAHEGTLQVSNAIYWRLERAMKNYSLLVALVVCCAFGLMPSASHAQGRTLTDTQLEAIVHPTLGYCSTPNQPNGGRIDAASIIPTANARAFPTDRIAKTMNGVWQGRVIGDDKDTVVDYFWLIDTKNSEGLAIALRNGKQTVPNPRSTANAPKFTFVLCAHEGYVPSKETPMMHEFIKVADSIADAPQILEKATGLKFQKTQPKLSDMWQEIVASGYFSNMPAIAFAGGMFKPMQIGSVASAVGPAGVSLGWNGEYRGGGATAIQYMTGVPIVGVEHGEFVGTTTSSGDYLVASPGNGKLWRVEADTRMDASNKGKGKEKAASVAYSGNAKGSKIVASSYDMDFDNVTLGPLQ
jgi:hypothetical protein